MRILIMSAVLAVASGSLAADQYVVVDGKKVADALVAVEALQKNANTPVYLCVQQELKKSAKSISLKKKD